MTEHADLATTVLCDCLCASADDLGYPLTRYSAARLSDRTLELLSLAGWTLYPRGGRPVNDKPAGLIVERFTARVRTGHRLRPHGSLRCRALHDPAGLITRTRHRRPVRAMPRQHRPSRAPRTTATTTTTPSHSAVTSRTIRPASMATTPPPWDDDTMSKARTVTGQLASPDGGWQKNADGRYGEAGTIDYADELPACLPVLIDHDASRIVGEVVAVERTRSGALFATAVVEDAHVDAEYRRYLSPGLTARRVDSGHWTDGRLQEVSLVPATAGVVSPINWHPGDIRIGTLGVRAFTGDPERARLARARQEYDNRWRSRSRHILEPDLDALIAAGDLDRQRHERSLAQRQAATARQHHDYAALVAAGLQELDRHDSRYGGELGSAPHPTAVNGAWR